MQIFGRWFFYEPRRDNNLAKSLKIIYRNCEKERSLHSTFGLSFVTTVFDKDFK